MIVVASTSSRKNGKAMRTSSNRSRPVMPWITNRLKPTGGVICAISTTRIR
ncbi:Uncharacterised protein [Bordetella pertussis]|nr:Uncharacterised protein [Bordetella pertussis]